MQVPEKFQKVISDTNTYSSIQEKIKNHVKLNCEYNSEYNNILVATVASVLCNLTDEEKTSDVYSTIVHFAKNPEVYVSDIIKEKFEYLVKNCEDESRRWNNDGQRLHPYLKDIPKEFANELRGIFKIKPNQYV